MRLYAYINGVGGTGILPVPFGQTRMSDLPVKRPNPRPLLQGEAVYSPPLQGRVRR